MVSLKEGYTAIEVMVVLALTAILAALGIANFATRIPHYNLADAGRQITSDLRMIRQRAISEGVSKSIQFTPNARSYTLSDTEVRTLPSYIRFGVKSGVPHLPDASSMPNDGVSFKDNLATFKPNGMISSMGTVYVTNDPTQGESTAISVNATGRVKIQRRVGDAWK